MTRPSIGQAVDHFVVKSRKLCFKKRPEEGRNRRMNDAKVANEYRERQTDFNKGNWGDKGF